MSSVFFKISDTQEKEVKNLMSQEGYTSKAEFFRFLIKFFKYNRQPSQEAFEQAADKLSDTLKHLKQQGKLSISIDEQLKDV